MCVSEVMLNSIPQRLGLALENPTEDENHLILIDDHVVFLALVAQAAHIAIRDNQNKRLVVLLDAHTANNVRSLEGMENSAEVHVAGGIPAIWEGKEVVSPVALPEGLTSKDHFAVFMADHFSIVLYGSAGLKIDERMSVFEGYWSIHSHFVSKFAECIFGDAVKSNLDGISVDDPFSTNSVGVAVRLMATQTEDLAMRQRSSTMDKADLFSVLSILKSISSHRRAHDILYVFVEQIARVIHSERCSIVRVWGEGDRGQVLASHEDEKVRGVEIELAKYPELLESMSTREPVLVSDVSVHPLTKDYRDTLKKAKISALLVVPIVVYDKDVGTLLLRAARSTGTFSLREISFFEIVAEAASNALERAHLFTSIQEANQRLERLAVTDGLTDLFNHRYFSEQIVQEYNRALRYDSPLSCLLMDIDNFKGVNDTYGHLVGDEVLRELAARIRGCIRKTDLAARYGGEEFVVVMPQTGALGARIEAKRLLDATNCKPFPTTAGDLVITCSIGVSTLDSDSMKSTEDLLRTVDEALYSAKTSGKNKVIVGKG